MAHLSGIGIGKYPRTLAAALAIGAAIVSFSPGQVNAMPIDDQLCATYDALTHHWEFYLPGETYFDGLTFVCGEDGEWE